MARVDRWALFMYALAFLQIGSAIAILTTTKERLWKTDLFSFNFASNLEADRCLLTYNNTNLCAYMIIVVSVSLVLSILLFFASCSTHRIWLGLQALLLGFGSLWWIPAAVTTTVYGKRSDDARIPEESARTAVWGLSWAELGLFLAALLATLYDCYRPRKLRGSADDGHPTGAYVAGKLAGRAPQTSDPLLGSQREGRGPAAAPPAAASGLDKV